MFIIYLFILYLINMISSYICKNYDFIVLLVTISYKRCKK